MQGSGWWLGNCEWHKTPWEYLHWQSRTSRKGWNHPQGNFSKGSCSCKQSFWYTPWDNINSPYTHELSPVLQVKSLTLGLECLLTPPLKIWFQLPRDACPWPPPWIWAWCLESHVYTFNSHFTSHIIRSGTNSELLVSNCSALLTLLTDPRYRQIPTFGRDTIRRFANNTSEMRKLAAQDFEDILQVSFFKSL